MVKIGNRIRILGFAPDADGTLPPSERKLVGKEGIVTGIDDRGGISGTWGFLHLLPVDTYEVVEISSTCTKSWSTHRRGTRKW